MTDMSSSSLEIVHEGWLTKSPPSKPIWRARWRRRWFVLRHSGELPGQYFLEYYTDRNRRKLKGKIDLDQCEQVDAGLTFESRKLKYQHMFDVKTPKRTYYLAAESEEEMNKWVECVCQVCGLKAYKDEDEEDEDAAAAVQLPVLLASKNENESMTEKTGSVTNISTTNESASTTDSPPVSPTSTVSGPYIAISECISGRPLSGSDTEAIDRLLQQSGYRALSQYGLINTEYGIAARTWQKAPTITTKREVYEQVPLPDVVRTEFYDSPRKLQPTSLDLQHGSAAGTVGTPPHSPTDAESVFTDDDWIAPGHGLMPNRPTVNWETFPSSAEADTLSLPRTTRPSDSSTEGDVGSWSVKRLFGRLTVVDSDAPPPAPPRPPKPSHLASLDTATGPGYMNLENVSPRPAPPVPPQDDGAQEPPSPVSPPHTDVVVVTDDMYDFPRSHQYPAGAGTTAVAETDTAAPLSRMSSLSRHCYSNAAPGQVNGDVFRYDFPPDGAAVGPQDCTICDEPPSPHSEGSCSGSVASSSTAAPYSNLPSPSLSQVPTPPAVDRGLKPGRKLSDTLSVVSSELSPGPFPAPPSVDRKLKPHRKFLDSVSPLPETAGPLKLASPPACRTITDGNRSLRSNRAAPSPTPPSSTSTALHNGQRQRLDHNTSSDEENRNSFEDEQYLKRYQKGGKRLPEIQYLDLDLDSDTGGPHSAHLPKSPERAACTGTVYKTVDFIKTEAFNRTRQHVEEERRKCPAEL